MAGTLAALVTASYAWFVSARSGEVTVTSAHIWSDSSDLKVEYVKSDNGSVSDNTYVESAGELNITGQTPQITDVSGNGESFYRPEWVPDKENVLATTIPSVANDSSTSYYVRFGLKLINEGTVDFSVYLSQGSVVSPLKPAIPASKRSMKQLPKARGSPFIKEQPARACGNMMTLILPSNT